MRFINNLMIHNERNSYIHVFSLQSAQKTLYESLNALRLARNKQIGSKVGR